MGTFTKSRLNILMVLPILYGTGLTIAFFINALTQGPTGNPDAIKYGALVFGL